MKIIVDTNEVILALGVVKNAISKSQNMPILNCVKIDSDNGVAVFIRNGLERIYTAEIFAEVQESGSCAINYDMLLKVLKNIKKGFVTIESENGFCTISMGNISTKVVDFGYENYPTLFAERFQQELDITVTQSKLKELLKMTTFAVSTDESRPVLNGCYFDCEDDKLAIVAIDGFRMAIARTAVNKNTTNQTAVVLGSDLKEIEKFLAKSKDNVIINIEPEIKACGRFARFSFTYKGIKVVFYSRTIEGEYMKYKEILKTNSNSIIEVNVEDLKTALNIGSSVNPTGKKAKAPIRVFVDENTLTFEANSEMGKSSSSIDFKKICMESVDSDFNSRYLKEIFDAINCENAKIEFGSAYQPTVIYPLYDDDFTYLVLPLRR